MKINNVEKKQEERWASCIETKQNSENKLISIQELLKYIFFSFYSLLNCRKQFLFTGKVVTYVGYKQSQFLLNEISGGYASRSVPSALIQGT